MKLIGLTLAALLHVTYATDEAKTRINGGEDAPEGRYGYMVSLQSAASLYHSCGGSLIAPDVVLTAAHCIDFLPESSRVVQTNLYRVMDPSETSQVLAPTKFVLHPDFHQPFRFSNDVALIKLNGTITDQPLIRLNDDPRVPFDGQLLTQTGWGDLSDRLGIYPSELQVLAEGATYVNNDLCSEIIGRNSIHRDMICTFSEYGRGGCAGDSGGPLFVAGTTPEEDIQVGITSFGYRCFEDETPSGFARVSWHYRFIRNTLCSLSDLAPEYFDCGNVTVYSSAPSASPAPSSSAAPSSTQIPVTVQLFLGRRYFGVGWSIETLDGTVLHKVDAYTYTSRYEFVGGTVNVPKGEILDFVVVDAFGGGLTRPSRNDEAAGYLFLGEKADSSQVLVKVTSGYEGAKVNSFTASTEGLLPPLSHLTIGSQVPSASPSTSVLPTRADLVTVTVFIDFDSYPVETVWAIFLHSNNRTIMRGGPYSPFVGANLTKIVMLEANETYRFAVYDRSQDGLCCAKGKGQVFVYLGTDLRSDQVLVYEDGNFGLRSDHVFVAAPSSVFNYTMTPSASPSMSAGPTSTMMPTKSPFFVTVSFFPDWQPWETSWMLLDPDDATILLEKEVEGEPHVTLALEYGKKYLFVVNDYDGICCGGYAVVVAGEEPLPYLTAIQRNKVLAFVEGDFDRSQGVSFVASPEGLIEATPRPTPARTVSAEPSIEVTGVPTNPPTQTNVPSANTQIDVLLVIELDYYVDEIGLLVETADTRRVVFATNDRNFFPGRYALWTRALSLDLGREYLLTVTDIKGDGLRCCESNYFVAVYAGSTPDIRYQILFMDGNFGFVRKQFFVASTEASLGKTESPTHTPTLFPTHSPSVSPSPTNVPSISAVPSLSDAPTNSFINITILVSLDFHPFETGWRLETMDGEIVAQVSSYRGASACSTYRSTVRVYLDVEYTITFTDRFGDGLTDVCPGRAEVYWGTEVANDRLLVRQYSGFVFSSSHTFMVASTSAPTTVPTTLPTTLPTAPTQSPTTSPTSPTTSPTQSPTTPSVAPSINPTGFPTAAPTTTPSISVSAMPSASINTTSPSLNSTLTVSPGTVLAPTTPQPTPALPTAAPIPTVTTGGSSPASGVNPAYSLASVLVLLCLSCIAGF